MRHGPLAALLVVATLQGCLPPPSVRASRKSDALARRMNVPKTRIDGLLLATLFAPDRIRALDTPRFHPAGEDGGLPGRARVLGLLRGGEARAYPLGILNRCELVNDVIGDEPIAVAWCPILQGGRGFVRVLGGEPVLLGISGKLWGNGLVAFDRPTGSLFTLWDGRALRGPWRGTTLESFEVELTSLARWRARHPDTQVLKPPPTPLGLHPRQRDRLGFARALQPPFLPPSRSLRRLHPLPEGIDR